MNTYFNLRIINNGETGYEIFGFLFGHEFSLYLYRKRNDYERYWRAINHERWVQKAYKQSSQPKPPYRIDEYKIYPPIIDEWDDERTYKQAYKQSLDDIPSSLDDIPF